MIYHSVAEVLADRRKGVALDEVIDSLLTTPHVWQIHGITPFSIIPQLYKTDYVDMSTPNWWSLPVELQMELARGYQQWYAHRLGLPEPEHIFYDGIEIEMRLIPPMKYWMGAPEFEIGRNLNEKQKLKLIKKPFWFGKTEVTQKEWRMARMRNLSRFGGDLQLPVEQVSWDDCQDFCKRTNTDIPTEEQWELACRAGTTTAYNFGNDPRTLGNYAWYFENSREKTQAVKKKEENAFGLYDMHGNVWEWTSSKYSSDLEYRVFRGGCWHNSFLACRSAYREWGVVSVRRNFLGFRVSRSV